MLELIQLSKWLMENLYYQFLNNFLNTLSIKPLEGRIVIECNPGISHKIIAELLGSGAVNT